MSDKLKTSGFVPVMGIFVFFFVFAPASAAAADKTVWAKYTNAVPPGTSDTTNWGKGRIPLGTNEKGDDAGANYQSVIKDGSTYRMWYSGYDESNWRIYYATSADGLTWTKYTNAVPLGTSDTTNWGKGRIPLGKAGTGDERGVWDPSVIKDDSTYKMWYCGKDSGNTSRIYYATSSNGLTWTKYTNAIPDNSNTTGTKGRIPLGTSGGDSSSAVGPCVIKDCSTYKMWYGGKDSGNTWRIYYATSSNGLTWTKYTNAVPDDSNTTGTKGRIPLGESGGDDKNVRFQTVVKVGSTYKMWYDGQDLTDSKLRIYYATSTDGLTWTKYTNAIPVPSNTTGTDGRIPVGTSGGDTYSVTSPCVIIDGYTYKMWYGGSDGSNTRIYHALLDALPEGTIFYSH